MAFTLYHLLLFLQQVAGIIPAMGKEDDSVTWGPFICYHWPRKYLKNALCYSEVQRSFQVVLFFAFFFFLFGPHLRHMEVPKRLGVELELQLPAYATATAMPDLSHICDPHQSLWQHRILNPVSKARVQTFLLMDTVSGFLTYWATGNSKLLYLNYLHSLIYYPVEILFQFYQGRCYQYLCRKTHFVPRVRMKIIFSR